MYGNVNYWYTYMYYPLAHLSNFVVRFFQNFDVDYQKKFGKCLFNSRVFWMDGQQLCHCNNPGSVCSMMGWWP